VPALSAQFISGSTGSAIGAIGGAAWSFIPIIGPILGALFGSLFGGTDLSQVTKQLNLLSQQLGQLGDTLTRFAWSIGFALGELARAIAEIWDNFLDALWDHLKQLWKLVWCEVSQVIPKIIQIIRDMRKYLDWIYKHILQPMQKWMQRARAVLVLLKALHVPFAARLDKILTQIQSAVFVYLYPSLRWFNIYGSWINSILTWDWTIQRAVFQRTMFKYQGDWINLWWTTQFQQSAPTSGGAPVPLAKPCTVGECAQQVQAMVAVTPSAFPPEVEAAAAELQSWVQTGV
jgi:MFS family permease